MPDHGDLLRIGLAPGKIGIACVPVPVGDLKAHARGDREHLIERGTRTGTERGCGGSMLIIEGRIYRHQPRKIFEKQRPTPLYVCVDLFG